MTCCIKRLTQVIPTQQTAPSSKGLPPLRMSFTTLLFKPMAAIAMTMQNFESYFKGRKDAADTPACSATVVISAARIKYKMNIGKARRS